MVKSPRDAYRAQAAVPEGGQPALRLASLAIAGHFNSSGTSGPSMGCSAMNTELRSDGPKNGAKDFLFVPGEERVPYLRIGPPGLAAALPGRRKRSWDFGKAF